MNHMGVNIENYLQTYLHYLIYICQCYMNYRPGVKIQ